MAGSRRTAARVTRGAIDDLKDAVKLDPTSKAYAPGEGRLAEVSFCVKS